MLTFFMGFRKEVKEQKRKGFYVTSFGFLLIACCVAHVRVRNGYSK